MKAVREPNFIPGSFAAPEAAAHLMAQKFVMGSPLYRQEQELKRQGIPLKRQTMSNWMLWAAEHLLTPVYDQLHKELLTRDVLHADETTLQVLHELDKTAQSKSYMWLYRTSGDTARPIVLYEYQPGRGSCHPKIFLTGFKARPVLDALLAWANTRAAAPKSTLGKALTYLKEQWPYLLNYLRDGRLELSNNRAERSIKPFAIDRKNFLFVNTPSGATSNAVIFSLIHTAIENGLDPYRYLSWLMSSAADMNLSLPENVQLLLPWNASTKCRTY